MPQSAFGLRTQTLHVSWMREPSEKVHRQNDYFMELFEVPITMRRNKERGGVKTGVQVPKGARSTAFLLAQVGAHAAAKFGERLTELHLARPHAGILRMVEGSPGLSQQELGRRLGILPSRLVTLLDELEERGFIERRQDLEDRRVYALHSTVAGQCIMEEIGRIAREHDAAICAALSADEKQQLNLLLRRIADQQGLTPGVHPGYRWLGRKAPVE
jgi:DNA-binding MarR family transcriptional regulator